MLRKIILTAVLMLSIVTISVFAVDAREEGDKPTSSLKDTNQLSAKSGLKIGNPLPDVTAYDADVNSFNLGRLKGHYSVIVFGCLT